MHTLALITFASLSIHSLRVVALMISCAGSGDRLSSTGSYFKRVELYKEHTLVPPSDVLLFHLYTSHHLPAATRSLSKNLEFTLCHKQIIYLKYLKMGCTHNSYVVMRWLMGPVVSKAYTSSTQRSVVAWKAPSYMNRGLKTPHIMRCLR